MVAFSTSACILLGQHAEYSVQSGSCAIIGMRKACRLEEQERTSNELYGHCREVYSLPAHSRTAPPLPRHFIREISE